MRGLRALGLAHRAHPHGVVPPSRGASIAISEVAARPPGAQFTSLLSYAHDVDMYAAWARLEIFGTFAPPERRYAVGAAYLRGQGDGSGGRGARTRHPPARARRPRRRGSGATPRASRRPAPTRVRATSSSAIPRPRWSRPRCAASSRWRASSSASPRDRDGADDLARVSGGDALLHARARTRRRARHRRRRSTGRRPARDGARPPHRLLAGARRSPTRTPSSHEVRDSAPPACTSTRSSRSGSRRWCSRRASARRLGMPGMTVEQTIPFRDKERDEAGARRRRASARRTTTAPRTAAGVRDAVERIGYPIIVKPIAGAGSATPTASTDAARARGACSPTSPGWPR